MLTVKIIAFVYTALTIRGNEAYVSNATDILTGT